MQSSTMGIDDAKRADTDIKNIYDFMESVNDIAFKNDIHVVVLSRTMAVTEYLGALSDRFQCYKLLPVSEEQQIKWLEEHKEYDDYKKAFRDIQNNRDMRELLGVPLLFRLIVHNRFKTVSLNTVELYNSLFINLLRNRHITDLEKIRSIEEGLMDLAYKVYCTDAYSANIYSKDLNSNWIFAFYIIAYNARKIGFFHRTFYQYFLAKYIFSKIVNIEDENVEDFIGSLAERELDDTVRQYLFWLFENGNSTEIHINIEKLIVALSKTEALIRQKPRSTSGDAEKSRILRAQNIYRNVFHITAAASHVIQTPFKGNLDIMVRKFRSEGLEFINQEEKCVVLKESCLAGACLRRAILTKADMTKVDLKGADLREAHLANSLLREANLHDANLKGANLSGADLSGADLRGTCMSMTHLRKAILAKTNLRDANLRRANLIDADLNEASLEKAYLTFAYLEDANLSGAYLRDADLRGADLKGACLVKANLKGADLYRADLSGADLSGAIIRANELIKSNLTGARIDIKFKEMIDPSTKGYSSIIWSQTVNYTTD